MTTDPHNPVTFPALLGPIFVQVDQVSLFMSTIHVYIERPTARSRYAIQQVMGRMLGWQVVYVDTLSENALNTGPLLVYGTTSVNGALHILPQGLLEAETVSAVDPSMGVVNGMPVLFPSLSGDLKFDPFAGAFFLLTGYQEVLGVPLDEHERPISSVLHPVRNGYVHRPVIDEWALHLAHQWKAKDPRMPDPVRQYNHVVSIDLDNGFMYRGREAWRTLGSAARDLLNARFTNVMERFRVLSGTQQDPYDIYETLRTDLPKLADRTIFFVLTAPRSQWDHAVPVAFEPYANNLKGLLGWAEVGLHPSYREKNESERLGYEKRTLQTALGKDVTLSRHHFLRNNVPDSFQHLVKEGFTEDHTMGLHDSLGFRVGTCTPFAWFDLRTNAELPITVHPFCVMDNTLRNKLKLDPVTAVEQATELIKRVRDVQGTFTGLWHESFLSDHGEFDGWGTAIYTIMKNAKA